MGDNTEPKLEFLEKVENTIEGVVDFVKDFGRTFAYLVYAPRRFGAKLAEAGSKPDFVRPFTFLGICTFAAIRVLKLFVLAVLLLLAAISRSCDGDTYQKFAKPKLVDLLVLPSWEEIVTIGLPIISVVLILAWLFNLALIRNRESAGQRLAYAACYAIGFQYLVFLLLGAPLYGVAFEDWMKQIGADKLVGNQEDVVNYYSLIALLVLVIWSTFVLSSIAHGQVRREDWRFQFRGSFLLNLVLAPFLFCTLTMAGGFGLAYPLANAEFKQKYTFKPYLLAGLVEETSVDGHLSSMTVGIVNNTDQSLQFDGKQVEVSYGGTYHGEIIDMKPPTGPVLTLLPHEHGWLVLSLTPEKYARPLSQIEVGKKLILSLRRVPTSDGPNVISVIVHREKKQADQEN